MAQRNLGMERICLAYMDRSLSLREPEGRNGSRGLGWTVFAGLLALRSYTIHGHSHRTDTSYREPCLLKSIISQEIVPQTCLQVNLVEALFANEVLSFHMALTCVMLTRNFPLRRPWAAWDRFALWAASHKRPQTHHLAAFQVSPNVFVYLGFPSGGLTPPLSHFSPYSMLLLPEYLLFKTKVKMIWVNFTWKLRAEREITVACTLRVSIKLSPEGCSHEWARRSGIGNVGFVKAFFPSAPLVNSVMVCKEECLVLERTHDM